ncbi:MAG: DNA-processing protein DprA [Lachnospiraceae bacterium]|nr:DNA-processing protein DprA [Lachnospiraceae bacterium]
MVDNIVLFLMQVNGIKRKTIYKNFHLESREYSIEDIQNIIKQAALDTTRIAIPSIRELEIVYDKYKTIVDQSNELGIRIISYLDKDFPTKLRKINDPPAVIYALGNIECLNEKAIAVIGTREPIEYGVKIAERLGYVLGRDGYTVVSGLAHGCDKHGHLGCLQANGKTVAVMARGLDKVYPAEHKELAQAIIESNGCLISEYPVDSKPFKNCFIERDRLQSGLSEGLIVVETDVKGGTWHTIEYAKEYGRRIGCYKHPSKYEFEKKTKGNQILLQQEDTVGIEDTDDLLEYKKLIDQKHEELMQEDTSVKMTQLSVMDFIGG